MTSERCLGKLLRVDVDFAAGPCLDAIRCAGSDTNDFFYINKVDSKSFVMVRDTSDILIADQKFHFGFITTYKKA